LSLLSENPRRIEASLGRTENEVATHILVREVYVMHAQRFHETRIPAPEGEGE